MVQLYDCYTITVLLTIEDSGFCGEGRGHGVRRATTTSPTAATSRSTPTAASSGIGQTGLGGGLSHVIEAVRQVQGRAGDRQLARHDTAYCSGHRRR